MRDRGARELHGTKPRVAELPERLTFGVAVAIDQRARRSRHEQPLRCLIPPDRMAPRGSSASRAAAASGWLRVTRGLRGFAAVVAVAVVMALAVGILERDIGVQRVA